MRKSFYMQASDDDDEEYEVMIDSYSPPTQDTREEPGDSGEVSLSPVVNRLLSGRKVEEVTLGEFLDRYATHSGVDPSRAERVVYDQAMGEAAWFLADQQGDDIEDRLEDR